MCSATCPPTVTPATHGRARTQQHKQVKAGSIFDNIWLGDSLKEAKKFAEGTWGKLKDAEKKMFDKISEEERKKKEEEEVRRARVVACCWVGAGLASRLVCLHASWCAHGTEHASTTS
jgi:hypothetical protein